ncbi:SDR family NAD(P)-dependent oxidoreductase [Kitasatospora sp. NPDC051853]|uniref:SDR family NAD(P)-dependent oxidoreductase n=1 Tax=Kitasatospora sp. NPDC051853 TaxID=3364058 RepID=UPI0037B10E54
MTDPHPTPPPTGRPGGPTDALGLAGRVVLVVGATGGIGAGVAERFAEVGAAVVLHGRRPSPALAEAAGRITADGGRATTVHGDLGNEAETVRAVRQAASHHGGLDAVVNCAGIQPVTPFGQLTESDWQSVVDTDLHGPVRLTRAAVPLLPRGGSVTHLASIEGSQPAPGHAHYATAKAALLMFARAAALELGPLGLRVNTVSPGLITRPGLAEAWPEGVDRWQRAAPLTRLGTPRDVADACLFLASPLASWITGHDLVVDGGVSAHPTW